MGFIHERSNWPSFTWDADALAGRLAEVRYHQGLLLGRMRSLGFDLRTEAVLTTVTTDIVTSSAIEGESLDPQQVRSSVARRLGLDTGGHIFVGKDVEGIVEMMTDATGHYNDPLTVERLFSWHAALFPSGRSGMRKITVGGWRTDEHGPMRVLSGSMGKEKVHFDAPSAHLVNDEMDRFLDWFNSVDTTDPILKAGIAHFWFVTIHPFDDGNGRIARAIADMLLARADGNADRFYSMSAQIESERREYYQRLENQQRADVNLTPWLKWFLECLDRSFARAEANLEKVLKKARIRMSMNKMNANERQQNVMERMMDNFEGYMTTSKYAKIAKCSTDTALRDIRELVQYSILIQNPAGGRSTSYRPADPSRDD